MPKHYPLTAEAIQRRIDRDQTGAVPTVRTTVTRSDLDLLGDLIAWKYNRALTNACGVAAREFERQLVLLARYADNL